MFYFWFANIAKSLNHTYFQWTPEVEATFQTLKGALCVAPVLSYPQPGKRFIVDTDASNIGIGRVLSQVQDRQECSLLQ
jgi:hypothetical protein